MQIKRNFRLRDWGLTAAMLLYGIGSCAAADLPRQTSSHSPNTASATESALALFNGLTRQSLSAFQSAFTTISNSAHVTILVEGVPFRQVLMDKEAGSLAEHLTQGADTQLLDVITVVALAYDYDVEQASPQMFLLRKKYSDQNDLPCVTYKEVVHSLKSILDVTERYSPIPVSTSGDDLIFPLYDTLSPEQKAHVGEGLRLADFSEEQRGLVLATARQLTLDSQTSDLRLALKHLILLQDPRTVFTRMRLQPGDAFGYQGPFGKNGITWHFPLDNGFTCQISGAYSRTIYMPAKSRLTDFTPPLPTVSGRFGFGYVEDVMHSDPTIPTEQDRFLSEGMLSRSLASTLTNVSSV